MWEPNPFHLYPEKAEAFWLNQAEEVTGLLKEEALERMTTYVSELSDLFTIDRPDTHFPDYFKDPTLLTAYGVFFLPQSFVRTSFALSYLLDFRQWKCLNPCPRILDLGSGPGSCGVSVAHQFLQRGVKKVDLVGVDKSPSALAGFEQFAQSVLGNQATISTRVGDASHPQNWPSGSFDVVVAGFVMNEMKQLSDSDLISWIQEVQKHLHPEGLLLIIEPALRQTSERLQRLSDHLAHRGIITRLGPDLDAHPCPQLAQGQHWSHEVRRWHIPATVDFVNRKLHRDLREVRFSFAAFSNQACPPVPTRARRIVSDIQMIKGLIRFVAVYQGQCETIEIATRGHSKHEVKLLAGRLERGDVIAHQREHAPKVRLASFADLEVLYSAHESTSQ
jgi:SAM-dependent methyltransferase